MNILAVCHYGMYSKLTSSFVHIQLREFVRLGHRVRVLIPIGIGKPGCDGAYFAPAVLRRSVDGVELCYVRYLTVSRFGEKAFNARMAIAAIAAHKKSLLADFVPDVIHAHTLGFDTEIGAWLKKKCGCPLAVTTHGSDTLQPMLRGEAAWLKASADCADVIVAVSSTLSARLAQCGTKTPIRTVYNGFIPYTGLDSIEKQPFRIAQVGNLIPRKCVDVTVQALALLRQDYPSMTLTVVGAGPERGALERLSEALGVSDAVEFLGWLPNEKAAQEMAKSTFFVMPSKHEGYGIVYLEAMAAGCVTVGTAGEGITDLITDGENGILVPPDDPQAIADRIAQCLHRPDVAQQIAQNGRQAANRLTWRSNAKSYIALFGELRRE